MFPMDKYDSLFLQLRFGRNRMGTLYMRMLLPLNMCLLRRLKYMLQSHQKTLNSIPPRNINSLIEPMYLNRSRKGSSGKYSTLL